MSLLDVQHIKKIYKTRFQGTQVEALKDIHFTVEKGEYVAIMGRVALNIENHSCLSVSFKH